MVQDVVNGDKHLSDDSDEGDLMTYYTFGKYATQTYSEI